MRLADRIRKAVDVAASRGFVLTQSGLAKACGISRASVHAWFHGDTDSIDGKHLTTAAAYLGVSPHWLGTGLGDMLNQVVKATSIPPSGHFGTPVATTTPDDIVIPQYAGGDDKLHNMQWITKEDHRFKTLVDVRECRKNLRR